MTSDNDFWAIVGAAIMWAFLLFTVTGNVILRVWLGVLESFTG